MKFRQLITLSSFCILSFAGLPFPASAVEDVIVDYSVDAAARTDLGNMKITLRIADFADSRDNGNSRLITDNDLGKSSANGGYQAEQALAEIIRDAMVQGFANAKARLVDGDEEMRLQGSLLSTQAQIVDREGVESIQLTLRTSVQLLRGSRTIWQTTLFGRGVTPVSEGIGATVKVALARLVDELISDDYFLLEIR